MLALPSGAELLGKGAWLFYAGDLERTAARDDPVDGAAPQTAKKDVETND